MCFGENEDKHPYPLYRRDLGIKGSKSGDIHGV